MSPELGDVAVRLRLDARPFLGALVGTAAAIVKMATAAQEAELAARCLNAALRRPKLHIRRFSRMGMCAHGGTVFQARQSYMLVGDRIVCRCHGCERTRLRRWATAPTLVRRALQERYEVTE